MQELTGHLSHINCAVFDIEGHFLFSGDNSGVIKMWESPEGLTQVTVGGKFESD